MNGSINEKQLAIIKKHKIDGHHSQGRFYN